MIRNKSSRANDPYARNKLCLVSNFFSFPPIARARRDLEINHRPGSKITREVVSNPELNVIRVRATIPRLDPIPSNNLYLYRNIGQRSTIWNDSN